MLKSNLLNLLLVIVVTSLAALIYFSEEESFQLDRVTDVDVNSITKIIIKHNTKTSSILKQGDKNWQFTQPINVAANSFRINSILKLINAPVHNQYAGSEVNTQALGLSLGLELDRDNSTTIQFVAKSKAHTFTFGTVNPATGLRYIQFNDSIYTIEDVYFPLISSHFGTLVSFDLLPDNSMIEKIILSNQTISQNDKGLWQSRLHSDSETVSTADSEANASTNNGDDIIKLIDNWKHTQAFGVHEYLQRDNLGEIKIHIKVQQKPVTYLITDTDPWLILARPDLGLEYHLDIEAYDKLARLP